jgi:heme A synthase
MTPAWLHRITVLLAACTFSLIVAGGVTVSKQIPNGVSTDHFILSSLTAILTLTTAWGLYLYDARSWMKRLGLIAILSIAALAALGISSSPAIRILHACAAQSFLALTFLLALFTSKSWQSGPLSLPDGGWPSLRSLAWITPAVVLLQVALGAAYRHKLSGVIPHIVWAFAAAIIIMMLATFVITLTNASRPMRLTSIWLLALVCLQVMLGIAAFVMRLNSTGPSDLWMVLATVTHAATGSLVLGCTAVLSAHILRNLVRSSATPTSHSELISSGRPS